jgi:hypothetical protein
VVLNPAKPYLEAAGAVSKRIEGPSWDKAMRSFEQQVSRHDSYVNHCDALTVRSPPLAGLRFLCSTAEVVFWNNSTAPLSVPRAYTRPRQRMLQPAPLMIRRQAADSCSAEPVGLLRPT